MRGNLYSLTAQHPVVRSQSCCTIWLAFLGEPRMGTVAKIKDLDNAPSSAQGNYALFKIIYVNTSIF